jgi:hypothetical protein
MRRLIVLALAVIVGLCLSLPASAQQQQGDKKFEVNGEVRFRGDYSDNATDLDSDGVVDDSGLVWPWRVRAGIHGSFTRNVSAHVEFQSFGQAGDLSSGTENVSGTPSIIFDPNGVGGGETQLYQGWVELGDIGGTSFDLRLGRQELVFGNEMLLGDLDFYNGINHDGARAGWQYKKWSLDVFYVENFEDALAGTTGVTVFPTSNGSGDSSLYGAYATFKGPKVIGFDAYGLLLNNNEDAFGIVVPGSSFPGFREERTTIGGRVYSKYDSNWSWWAELALQSGEYETGGVTTDISAQGFEGELAYQWRKARIKPRVHLRYSFFTGDDDDTDESEAFNPLFQDFHGRYGKFDLFRATNLNALQVGVSWAGRDDRHKFGVNLVQFTSNEETLNAGAPGAGVDIGEDDLGSELDLYYKYAYTKNVDIMAAIANFSPGDQFETVVASDASPELSAVTNDDSAMRVYVNTRLRW